MRFYNHNCMIIGNVKVDDLILAPMAGVNNIAFMLLCKRFGAHIYTAMLDAKRVIEEDNYTIFPDELKPLTIQLVGGNPEIMGKAAKFLCENKRCDIIDINMGCIEGDVLGKKQGCYLMQNENILFKIVESVINNSSVPVTAKIRSGWSETKKNAIPIAKKLEELGISAITVHPRTKEQKYMGKADYGIIKQVKNALKIPVIGSGDVVDADSYNKLKNICDAVMIGRAAKGDPEIFKRINTNQNKNLETQKKLFIDFIEYYKKYDNRNFGEIQTHALWFFKGLKASKSIVPIIMKCENEKDLLREILNLY